MNVEFYEPLFSRTLSIASSIFLASSPIIVVIFVRVFFLGEFHNFEKKKTFRFCISKSRNCGWKGKEKRKIHPMAAPPMSKNDVNIEVDIFRGHEPPRKGFVEYRIVSLLRMGETCSRVVAWRRYSEFFRLRSLLLKEYGSENVGKIVFPPKSLIGKYDPIQLESRRRSLHLFMNECVRTLPVRFCFALKVFLSLTHAHYVGRRTNTGFCQFFER